MPPSTYLSIADIAEMLELQPSTIRNYLARGYMPQPDVRVGAAPGWKPATVEKWLRDRPGQGRTRKGRKR